MLSKKSYTVYNNVFCGNKKSDSSLDNNIDLFHKLNCFPLYYEPCNSQWKAINVQFQFTFNKILE